MKMLIGYLLLNACLVLLFLWGHRDVRRFLAAHVAIADTAALDSFKRLARRNMYGAVIFGTGFLVSVFIGFWIIYQLGTLGLFCMMAVVTIIFIIGYKCKASEKMTRSLECRDPALRVEYERVGKSWTKKLFPDF